MKKSTASFTVFLLALTYAYAWGLHLLPSYDRPTWQSIALLNTLLALISLLAWKSKAQGSATTPERFSAWVIGPLLLAMNLLVIMLSAQVENVRPSSYPYTFIEVMGLCLWVPIIEEIIFRRFISEWIATKFDGLWSIYLSGLIFALAHTSPPLNLWPPLGPFLLGCACTWSYRVSGHILAPVLLHAAANASAILFSFYAPAWLDLLSWLYQKL